MLVCLDFFVNAVLIHSQFINSIESPLYCKFDLPPGCIGGSNNEVICAVANFTAS